MATHWVKQLSLTIKISPYGRRIGLGDGFELYMLILCRRGKIG
jgi:hypothetical protein